MKQRYIRAMDLLHRLCITISVVCLLTMTIVVPWGVFTRYVLGFGSSWPEPLAILMMIVFSFFSAAACYRDNLHIAITAIVSAVAPAQRQILGWIAEGGMIAMNLFMLIWGFELARGMMYQVIAEFPLLSVGLTYAPIPIGGGITLLFIVERLWTGAFFVPPDAASVGRVDSE